MQSKRIAFQREEEDIVKEVVVTYVLHNNIIIEHASEIKLRCLGKHKKAITRVDATERL